MAEVVEFKKPESVGESTLHGKARCLDCKREWEAVMPLGTLWLECPSCFLVRGRMIYDVQRDGSEWYCNCGNDLFRATPNGFYCPNCGEWQNGF